MIDQTVVFKEDSHQYFNTDGLEYMSCNKFIDKFVVPFDPNGTIARACAKKEGITKAEMQKRWEDKAADSHVYGNEGHKVVEDYYKEGKMPPRGHKMYDALQETIKMLSQYKNIYSEENICLPEHGLAGKPDLLCTRNCRTKIVDIPDIKTNKFKGIVFDSVKRTLDNEYFITYSGRVEKHNNRYFLEPIDHLEQCGYNRYCLQTSIYAFMMEQNYGYKIGSIYLLFYYFNKDEGKMKLRRYPIPYMRHEVLAMLRHYKDMKKV
jgi:hypothetical protein